MINVEKDNSLSSGHFGLIYSKKHCIDIEEDAKPLIQDPCQSFYNDRECAKAEVNEILNVVELDPQSPELYMPRNRMINCDYLSISGDLMQLISITCSQSLVWMTLYKILDKLKHF